jgi:hypothetical protein
MQNEVCRVAGRRAAEKPDHWHRRLLRTRDEGCVLRSSMKPPKRFGVDVKHRLPNSGIFEIAVNASLAFNDPAPKPL